MCKKLLILTLAAAAVLSPAALKGTVAVDGHFDDGAIGVDGLQRPQPVGTVIVDDHFDDGAIGTNTKGIGTGFNSVEKTGGTVTESNSFAHLNNAINGAARSVIASKDGIVLGPGVARFQFKGITFARDTANTGTGTCGRTAVGVRGNNTAEDVHTAGVANGFWIQFESGDIGEANTSWSGISTLFYESSAHVKTVLATWRFNTLSWHHNDPATMNFKPVLDVTLDLSANGYSLTIKGDTISSVTGSLSNSYESARIKNELTKGYAFAYNQGEAPGLDMSIDEVIISSVVPGSARVLNPRDAATDEFGFGLPAAKPNTASFRPVAELVSPRVSPCLRNRDRSASAARNREWRGQCRD
jgi:hypothetical protein